MTTQAARTDPAVLRRLLEPADDDERSLGQRYEDLAEELGVTRRTLERQVARLTASGLVDSRMLQDLRRTVDARWDSACLQVLDACTNASNPTKQAVIRRTNEAYLQAVPDGQLPSPSVTYRRLAELDHGRYTFGAAKQRRSAAKRRPGCWAGCGPTGPANTCCSTPTASTCSLWNRSPCAG